jgi:A/G-specific adenine glycosylase
MTGYYVELAEKDRRLRWVAPEALRQDYALPSAFRCFLKVLESEI